jgi:hypothetical protein
VAEDDDMPIGAGYVARSGAIRYRCAVRPGWRSKGVRWARTVIGTPRFASPKSTVAVASDSVADRYRKAGNGESNS